MEYAANDFITFNLAIMVLFVGRYLSQKSVFLRKFSIPDPLAGGLLCAIIIALLTIFFNFKITFASEPRDFLLVYFFAAIGLRAKITDLATGGVPLVILIIISTVFIFLQNLVGIGAAVAYGLDPVLGVVAGSVSLVGGVGTTVAWAPIFESQLGIENATEIGIACNTVGMISACLIGGPIAQRLIYKHKIRGTGDANLEVGEVYDADQKGDFHYYNVLRAIFLINIAVTLGWFLHQALTSSGVVIPLFVPVLVAGIIINNVGLLIAPKVDRRKRNKGIALISDISLGGFLSMALMSMDLLSVWQSIGFVALVMSLQILLAVLYALFIVFRFMGKDYDATVVSAGFGGIALGSTATAVLNMTSVAQKYGASHKAFLIVPLVCGFFIDLTNAVIIGLFTGL
ncbi:sodium/glutamate symporter [Flexibacterium corallicola]|uniref:sodium/glutamate symporter n=1 Tax=Flexibacterium corallicola TaxID=3037259 RepID=UPI00286F7D5B|nr:sodium/glutamate symporter [Pseudovibrio sp. M1P-2-3]